MNLRFQHLLLAAAFAMGCLQSIPAAEAVQPSGVSAALQRSSSSSIDTTFEIVGNAKGGFYRQIRGSIPGGTLSLSLERKSSVVNVGGLLVEGNPNFFVTGDVVGKKVDLKIVPEDLIADIGGMKVQTGTIYHVTGNLADRKINADLTEDETISDLCGMKVVTETWATLKSHDAKGPLFELRRVSVVADAGGFKVEQDRYNTCKGRDWNGKTEFTIRDWVSEEDTIKVSGTGSPESLALLLALRPFLNI